MSIFSYGLSQGCAKQTEKNAHDPGSDQKLQNLNPLESLTTHPADQFVGGATFHHYEGNFTAKDASQHPPKKPVSHTNRVCGSRFPPPPHHAAGNQWNHE